MQLADVHSRAGSVIVAADAVVPSDTVRSSAASLSVALLDITGLNVAVAGQTGPVGAVVGDATGESEYIYNPTHRQSSCLSVCSSVTVSLCLSFYLSVYHSVLVFVYLPRLYLSVSHSVLVLAYHFVVVFVSLSFRSCNLPPALLAERQYLLHAAVVTQQWNGYRNKSQL